MKQYVIVGGRYGIGLVGLHLLAKRGGRVTVISRTRGGLPRTSSIEHIPADVSKDKSGKEMLPEVVDRLAY